MIFQKFCFDFASGYPDKERKIQVRHGPAAGHFPRTTAY